MKKHNALSISELEMNMDEAMELFSADTLDSMQMASVYGGGIGIPWKDVAKWVAEKIGEGIISETIKGWASDPTPPTTGEIVIKEPNGKETKVILPQSADSVILKTADGSEFKFYNPGATPTN